LTKINSPSKHHQNSTTSSSSEENSISNSTVSAALIQEKQNLLNEMKNSVNEFIDVMIKASKKNKRFRFLSENENSNETELNQTILKTEIFSVEVASQETGNEKELRDAAVKSKLSVANFTQCEIKLKSFHNISENVTLLYKKMEFDPKTDLSRAADPSASSGVSFEFFDPDTLVKLNTSVCTEIPIPISIPFKKAERLSMSLYLANSLVNKDVDIYNKESTGFHSRCVKSKDLNTSADTSMSFRRNTMFQNETIGCSDSCTYQGLDENGYVKCDCNTSGKEEMSNTGSDFAFDPIPKMNYDIVMCYNETYNDVILILNKINNKLKLFSVFIINFIIL